MTQERLQDMEGIGSPRNGLIRFMKALVGFEHLEFLSGVSYVQAFAEQILVVYFVPVPP